MPMPSDLTAPGEEIMPYPRFEKRQRRPESLDSRSNSPRDTPFSGTTTALTPSRYRLLRLDPERRADVSSGELAVVGEGALEDRVGPSPVDEHRRLRVLAEVSKRQQHLDPFISRQQVRGKQILLRVVSPLPQAGVIER